METSRKLLGIRGSVLVTQYGARPCTVYTRYLAMYSSSMMRVYLQSRFCYNRFSAVSSGLRVNRSSVMPLGRDRSLYTTSEGSLLGTADEALNFGSLS